MYLKLSAPKNTGEALGTLIRTMLIECSESVKPIGFYLEGCSSFVPSNTVIDTIHLAQKLNDLTFECDESINFPTVLTVQFVGELRSSDLISDGFNVLEDVPLVNCIDNSSSLEFKLVLNKTSGSSSIDTNRGILKSLNAGKSFKALQCRSNEIRVSFKVQHGFNSDIITFNIKSKTDPTPNVKKCLQELSKILENVEVTS